MKIGKVILVGAGPGDSGLLTLKGKIALENADVVLYDRLVSQDVLAIIPADAERIDVGKSSGNHTIAQEKINELLLEYALAGNVVVRLKGGDPYLFGRGAEEISGLKEAGIAFEVIPGVTSALAAAAYAGIPVTHRDFVSSVHIFTAHAKADGQLHIDYKSAVKLGGTLIFLMGVSAVAKISEGLLQAGMNDNMPAAIIENGSTMRQRKIISTIKDIPAQMVLQNIASPAILIVGEVCRLSDQLDWFSAMPLFGTNVLVTRNEDNGRKLADKLQQKGCNVTNFPCVTIEALPLPGLFFDRLRQYGWIVFTSVTGVRLFFENLLARHDIRVLVGIKFAAVGAATAKQIMSYGLRVDFVPDAYEARELAIGLVRNSMPCEKLLLFRAKSATKELPEILSEYHFEYDDFAAYETTYAAQEDSEIYDAIAKKSFDFVTFSSASAVNGFASITANLNYSDIHAVCIGPKTAEKAAALGMKVSVSNEATLDSMVDLIIELGGKAHVDGK